jgi:hypothetical protein
MSEFQDPLLKKQKSIEKKISDYEFLKIPQEIIDVVDANIWLVWIMGNYKKYVRPQDIIRNVQQIFQDENIKLTDIYWKEHCSASLRELVDRNFYADCRRFLNNIPDRSNSDDEKIICERIQLFKDFFNDFAHFNKIYLNHLKKILNNYSLEYITEEVFDRICTIFIMDLYEFFKYKNR